MFSQAVYKASYFQIVAPNLAEIALPEEVGDRVNPYLRFFCIGRSYKTLASDGKLLLISYGIPLYQRYDDHEAR